MNNVNASTSWVKVSCAKFGNNWKGCFGFFEVGLYVYSRVLRGKITAFVNVVWWLWRERYNGFSSSSERAVCRRGKAAVDGSSRKTDFSHLKKKNQYQFKCTLYLHWSFSLFVLLCDFWIQTNVASTVVHCLASVPVLPSASPNWEHADFHLS